MPTTDQLRLGLTWTRPTPEEEAALVAAAAEKRRALYVTMIGDAKTALSTLLADNPDLLAWEMASAEEWLDDQNPDLGFQAAAWEGQLRWYEYHRPRGTEPYQTVLDRVAAWVQAGRPRPVVPITRQG